MMSNGNDDCVLTAFDDDDVIREAPKNKTLGSFVAGLSRHWQERKKAVFYDVNGGIDSIGKFRT